MDIVRVYGGDWEGIYANGGLVFEGHSIDSGRVLTWLAEVGVAVSSYRSAEADDAWLYNRGDLPPLLCNVTLAAREEQA